MGISNSKALCTRGCVNCKCGTWRIIHPRRCKCKFVTLRPCLLEGLLSVECVKFSCENGDVSNEAAAKSFFR